MTHPPERGELVEADRPAAIAVEHVQEDLNRGRLERRPESIITRADRRAGTDQLPLTSALDSSAAEIWPLRCTISAASRKSGRG